MWGYKDLNFWLQENIYMSISVEHAQVSIWWLQQICLGLEIVMSKKPQPTLCSIIYIMSRKDLFFLIFKYNKYEGIKIWTYSDYKKKKVYICPLPLSMLKLASQRSLITTITSNSVIWLSNIIATVTISLNLF